MIIDAIIPCGGSSSRFGGEPKLLSKIRGKEVIYIVVKKMIQSKSFSNIILSVNSVLIEKFYNLFNNFKEVKIIEGGETRQKSIFNALQKFRHSDFVLIHDGARPFIEIKTIKKSIETAIRNGIGAAVGVKTIDTIKVVDANLDIKSTPDRNFLFNIQTPQVFKTELLYSAHEYFLNQDHSDDSMMLEKLGYKIKIVEGQYSNIKITTKQDLIFGELLNL